MRRTALAALATALLTLPAAAADKAGPAPAPAAAPVVELVSPWNGLYVGVLAGHSAGTLNDAEGFKVPREGYTATGLVGYNHRLPGVVVGGELDLGVTDISGETNAGGGFTVRGSSKALGSLRGRIGLPFKDSVLVYATAGLALETAKLTIQDLGSSSDKNTKGYVFGGGIELFPFASNLGLRIEALRYQWVGQSFAIHDIETGKLGSHDTHVRAGLVVRLN